MTSTHSVTVGICTFNRASLLDQTLESLSRVTVPSGLSWEVVVIDNNCTDNTPEIAARHRGHLPLRIVKEPVVGLCAARNRVVAEATGEFIIYIDDDVLVDKEWLVAYSRACSDWPETPYFGGTVRPHYAVEPPRWVTRNESMLAEPYSLAEHGQLSEPLGSRKIVGANMAFRKWVLQQHPFNPAFGQVGAAAMRGDETELLGRLREAGMFGVWVGGAGLRHHIPAARLTTRYLWHWYGGLGAFVARRGVAPTALLLGAPRWALRRYALLLAKYWLLAPFKGKRWMRTLRDAGLMKGYIAEIRHSRARLNQR